MAKELFTQADGIKTIPAGSDVMLESTLDYILYRPKGDTDNPDLWDIHYGRCGRLECAVDTQIKTNEDVFIEVVKDIQ